MFIQWTLGWCHNLIIWMTLGCCLTPCLFIEVLLLGECHVWQVNLNLFYICNSPSVLASIEEIIARRGEWVSRCYAHFGSVHKSCDDLEGSFWFWSCLHIGKVVYEFNWPFWKGLHEECLQFFYICESRCLWRHASWFLHSSLFPPT